VQRGITATAGIRLSAGGPEQPLRERRKPAVLQSDTGAICQPLQGRRRESLVETSASFLNQRSISPEKRKKYHLSMF
jgi:hypothetical protein